MSHYVSKYPSNQVFTTACNSVVVSNVDIGNYKNLVMGFRNTASVSMLNVVVQANHFPTNTDGWVNLATTTLPYPSAVGTACQVYTSAVILGHKWIRVLGHVTSTSVNDGGLGAFTVSVSGKREV